MKNINFIADHEGSILFLNNEEGTPGFSDNTVPYPTIYSFLNAKSGETIKRKIKKAVKKNLTSLPLLKVTCSSDQLDEKNCKIKLKLIYSTQKEHIAITGKIYYPEPENNRPEFLKQYQIEFIDNLPVGIYRTGIKGEIHYASKKFAEILGFGSVKEIYGINIKELFVDKKLRKKLLKDWENNPMEPFELQMLKKNGELIWVKDTGRLIKNANKEVILLDGVIEDITAKKESDRKIKESEAKLMELNTSKDLLFSIISHDLRTPFNQFIGGTELLLAKLEEYDKSMLRKFLTLLNKEAVRSYRLLENLLQWSKAQGGLIKFDPKPIDFFEFTKNITGFYESLAEEKGIQLYLNIPNELYVYADKEMLSTILRNLVSNAIKFTQKGGEIKINAKEITDLENMFSKYVEISIADTGIGIPKESIASIFNINKKISSEYNESATGLGLLLCKDFVEKHNGEIWVESTYGKGSTFYFTIK